MYGSHVTRYEFGQRSVKLSGGINGNRRRIQHHAMARQFRKRSSGSAEGDVNEFSQRVVLTFS
jgi:hypothetical protein